MNKLTDWEAGQELIKAYDAIGECIVELRYGGHAEKAEFLNTHRNAIAKYFNKLGTHDFGLGVFPEKKGIK